MNDQVYTVYILTNKWHTVLYIGVTSNLARRVFEHRNKIVPGFTSRYNLTDLVYYETGEDRLSALEREKELKGWRREKKENLITARNPSWKDLSNEIN